MKSQNFLSRNRQKNRLLLLSHKSTKVACLSISYLESSFLTAHVASTKRATLERSVRGAVLIGCSKTMQMTGSKLETQYGGQHAKENSLQS